jgi:hypothetical protein
MSAIALKELRNVFMNERLSHQMDKKSYVVTLVMGESVISSYCLGDIILHQ